MQYLLPYAKAGGCCPSTKGRGVPREPRDPKPDLCKIGLQHVTAHSNGPELQGSGNSPIFAGDAAHCTELPGDED